MTAEESFTRRERLSLAFAHEPVDRLPTQINYTKASGEILCRHFGVKPEALPDRLDNHLLRVDLSYPANLSGDGKISFDHWGAGWDTEQEGYWLSVAPLANTDSIDHLPEGFAWPEPNDATIYVSTRAAIETDRSSKNPRYVAPNLGFALFERAWSLVGFDRLMLEMGLNPDFVEALLDKITDVQVGFCRQYVALGVDCGYFGDDHGAQNGLLFSPASWRRLIKPRLARLFSVFREQGLPVILHSDGNITSILPDLVEIGLSVLNPVQPEVLDHEALRRTFGNNLAYYGGVSTQSVLPHGTPDEVEQAAHTAIRALAPKGTGLLAAPSHRLASDIPPENLVALLRAFGKSGEGYPSR